MKANKDVILFANIKRFENQIKKNTIIKKV